ncbi:MAG: efflux RND transporter periplasmic adaptor subunit [Acidobacteria bacterium]|nr:efflux RND transporter periplasmic adaptor subunit [Acidobacteriota bacterium]
MFRPILPLSLIILLLSACAPPKGGTTKAENTTNENIVFNTAKATVKEVPFSFQATGAFIAEESSDVAPAIGGRVASTPVEVGDFVRKGQAICILEHRDAQLKLDHAHAGREQAKFMLSQAQSRVGWSGDGSFNPELVPEVASSKAAYESALASSRLAAADAQRYANLVASGDVSQSNYEKFKTQQQVAEAAANSARKQYEAQVNAARQNYRAIEAAQASLAAAESQLAQAQKSLEDTTIRAPFDGYITDRPVSVGQWVGTNNKVATLVRISTVRLQLQIPEQRAADVKTGMTVTARVAAYPDRDFNGKVHAVVPSVDSSSRAFMVEARFDNPKGELRPGMFANAKLMLPGTEKAVFVPAKSVFYDSTIDANHIFNVVNGVARLNVVLKGDTDGDQVRVLNGLTGNETVVLNNQADLYDGAPVKIHP